MLDVPHIAASSASGLHAIGDLARAGTGAAPIVIQGGLSSTKSQYRQLAQILESRGFTVFVNPLPWHGWASAKTDAEALSRTVQDALRATGADKVTLIGHSKGGLSSRWYLQRLGGVEHVAQLITLGTPHNGVAPLGTTLASLTAELPTLPALRELASGSAMLRELGDDLPGFLSRARAADPVFRMTSIASNMRMFGRSTGGDGLVGVAAARLPAIDGASNIVITNGPRSHFSIAAQGTPNAHAMEALVELAAGARRFGEVSARASA